jgi:hypothetical protein
LGALVFNPTNIAQDITVMFSVANFGIGMPFGTTGITTPTQTIQVPPNGVSRVKTYWNASQPGHFCVQIQLQSAGHDPVYSRRNIDVGEPLRPDAAHSRIIEIRNPLSRIATIAMGLISHRPDWTVTLTPMTLTDVQPGEVRPVTLSVLPSSWAGLADENPIADVEAYIDGELIGGIRKIAKPPVPLHKPQDQPYAESEISVKPDPPVANKAAVISTEVTNSSSSAQTIHIEFRVANFGIGIPWSTTGVATPAVDVSLGAGAVQTVSTNWTPPSGGHWCIQIRLQDPNSQYPEQRSQRNVDVERRVYQQCQSFTKQFLVQNPTPLQVTVTLGANAINLPPGWTYTVSPTEVILDAFQSVIITLTITPPCPTGSQPMSMAAMLITGGASGPPEINVEAYVDGQRVADGGGIQIRLEAYYIYLPILRR